MASYNYTFQSGDTVTPTKLNAARTVKDIVNADIKSDAAIAGTKIAPNFGSQNILATGTITSNGTGNSFATVSGGTSDGASIQLNRGGSASQNAFITQFQGALVIKNLDSGPITFTNTTSDTERVRIDSSGRLGIGTNSPNTPCDVQCDSGAFGIQLRGRSADNISVMRFVNNAADATYGQLDARSNQFIVNAVANIPLVFNTNNTERMRISAAGFVGIGASSPGVPLDIQADTGATGMQIRGRAADNISVLRFVNNAADAIYGQFDVRSNQFIINAVANAPMTLHTNNTERMRILADGNVGIGTNSPATALHVNGTTRATIYQVGTNQVVGARVTGWGAPTGTISRSALTTTASATYSQSELNAVIQSLKAVITDLRTHGLIGN